MKKPRRSIAPDRAVVPLTDAQRDELDRRLADHEANPDDVISWAEIRAAANERGKA
jgi:putative addiction module component (TIGR02574 family)